MEKEGAILNKRYVLGRLLGQGNFAKVYHARNLHTGKHVAIKVIDKRKVVQVNLINQIKREISVMRLCQHPNVVQLYEVMASKSKIYLAVEYLKGGELFAKVAKGRLKEEAARKYFQQLIAAIDYCHSMGVYHRDLKPENILLDEFGNLKVMDFGLSALAESRGQDGLLHTSCGTPAYVAPEILRKRGYDGEKADIWSCGVILFVLLAGYLPFHDSNLMVMYNKISRGEFKCPQYFPYEVKRLLRQLLDPNPRTRMSVSEIMKNEWFLKGFKQSHGESPRSVIDFEQEWDECCVEEHPEAEPNAMIMRPPSLNAFDIISRSSSFDLSGLFENGKSPENETRFTIQKPAATIVSKLELSLMDRYQVKAKDGVVRVKSCKEGRRGQLAVSAEIFEITPSLHVVEVKHSAGDSLEYKRFCDQELRPSLRDMI